MEPSPYNLEFDSISDDKNGDDVVEVDEEEMGGWLGLKRATFLSSSLLSRHFASKSSQNLIYALQENSRAQTDKTLFFLDSDQLSKTSKASAYALHAHKRLSTSSSEGSFTTNGSQQNCNGKSSSDGTEAESNNLNSINDTGGETSTPIELLGTGAISYGSFWTLVRQYAGCLRRLGVTKGARVAAQVTKHPNNVALYLATLQLGSIYLPLNTDYTFEEIRYFLNDATPSLFVCRQESVEEYIRVSNTHPNANTTAVDSNGNSTVVPNHNNNSDRSSNRHHPNHQIVGEHELKTMALSCGPLEDICPMETDDIASICYTSGTTGKPKGAMISHGNLLSNCRTISKHWEMNNEDVLLHSLPTYHVHGLFVAINSSILSGASMVFLSKFDLDRVLKWLPQCTIMMGVPTYYSRLLSSSHFGAHLLPKFRLFISGSAPMLADTWNTFRQRSGGMRILERYGMTEGQMVCSNPYNGERVPETVGFALPGIDVRVQDGVLQYRGPNVFLGYWKKPEKTKSEFTNDGYFISGDLAKMDETGRVSILGRGKDLIISGGLNVYPKEIEVVMDGLAAVLESAVIGVPNEDYGEVAVAVIVPQHLDNPPDQAHIIAQCKKTLAGYKVPKKVFFVDNLPRNAMGKVQKNVLRDNYDDAFRV